jgi:hypothetical protein
MEQMMADKRKPLEIFQTPVGELLYPWLNEADTRYTPTGVFQTKLRLSFEQAQDLIAQMERIRDAKFAELDPQKSATYSKKDVYDVVFTEPPEGATEEEKAAFVPEPTDFVEFKCKLNKVVQPKEGDAFEQSVILIDKDEQPLTVNVWSGSKARIRGQVVPWANAAQKQVGVTLRMKAVQVIDLVTGEGSSWGQFD